MTTKCDRRSSRMVVVLAETTIPAFHKNEHRKSRQLIRPKASSRTLATGLHVLRPSGATRPRGRSALVVLRRETGLTKGLAEKADTAILIRMERLGVRRAFPKEEAWRPASGRALPGKTCRNNPSVSEQKWGGLLCPSGDLGDIHISIGSLRS